MADRVVELARLLELVRAAPLKVLPVLVVVIWTAKACRSPRPFIPALTPTTSAHTDADVPPPRTDRSVLSDDVWREVILATGRP
jgi:hypothetical protein